MGRRVIKVVMDDEEPSDSRLLKIYESQGSNTLKTRFSRACLKAGFALLYEGAAPLAQVVKSVENHALTEVELVPHPNVLKGMFPQD